MWICYQSLKNIRHMNYIKTGLLIWGMVEILFWSQNSSFVGLSKPFLAWNLLFDNLFLLPLHPAPPPLNILRINYCKVICKWKAYINSKWCCYTLGDVPVKYWQKPLFAKACIDVLNSCCRTVPLGASYFLCFRYVNWQLKIITLQHCLWCQSRNLHWTTWNVVLEFQLSENTLLSSNRKAIQNTAFSFLKNFLF